MVSLVVRGHLWIASTNLHLNMTVPSRYKFIFAEDRAFDDDILSAIVDLLDSIQYCPLGKEISEEEREFLSICADPSLSGVVDLVDVPLLWLTLYDLLWLQNARAKICRRARLQIAVREKPLVSIEKVPSDIKVNIGFLVK